MSKPTDIIEAAPKGEWWHAGGVVCADGAAQIVAEPADADGTAVDFVATFDPEHVALMEAVCEAVERYLLNVHDVDRLAALMLARDRLTAYRREHGLLDNDPVRDRWDNEPDTRDEYTDGCDFADGKWDAEPIGGTDE